MKCNRYVVFICFFLLACSGAEEPKQDRAFIGGSEGLKMSLIEGSPPRVVRDQNHTTFSTSVVLENVGEADVGNNTRNPYVTVRLAGLNMQDPSRFNLERGDLAKRVKQRVRGAEKNFDGTILPGEMATVTFENMQYNYNVVGSQVFRLRAEACYDYATHASLKICLKREMRDRAQDASLCDVRSKLQPRSSGAPLQVVHAEQRPLGRDRVEVEFSFQNVGNGDFYSRAIDAPLSSCGWKYPRKHRNEAFVVVEPLPTSAYRLECKRLNKDREGFKDVSVPDGAEYGVVHVRRGTPRQITCTFTQRGRADQRVVQGVLSVHLYYRYGEAIEVPIMVQDASGYDVSKDRGVSLDRGGPGGGRRRRTTR